MTQQKTISPLAWLLLGTLALIWGGSFLSFAVALRELPVFTVVAARVGFAALAMWAYVWWLGIAIPRGWRVHAAFLVMGMLMNVIPFSLIAWGQTQIESGLAAILNATTAFFGVLVAAVFLPDEKLTGRKLGGVVLGICGVAVVIGVQTLRQFDLRALGQLALLGSSLSYGFGGSWNRRKLAGVNPVAAATLMLTYSSLTMVSAVALVDGLPSALPSWSALAAIGYISVIATALAFTLLFRAMALAGAGNVSLVTLLVVPVAVLLGALVLGEALPVRAYAGFALIALGLVVIDGRLAAVIAKRRAIAG